MQVSRGTVYLRGKTWTIGCVVAGRRVREAIGTNRQMAEVVLKKRIVQALEGRHFNVRNEGRIPFSEFAVTYIHNCLCQLLIYCKSGAWEGRCIPSQGSKKKQRCPYQRLYKMEVYR